MTTRDGRLRLPEIWTVFLIPVAGAVLAGLVLLGEILYYRKFYKGGCCRPPSCRVLCRSAQLPASS